MNNLALDSKFISHRFESESSQETSAEGVKNVTYRVELPRGPLLGGLQAQRYGAHYRLQQWLCAHCN